MAREEKRRETFQQAVDVKGLESLIKAGLDSGYSPLAITNMVIERIEKDNDYRVIAAPKGYKFGPLVTFTEGQNIIVFRYDGTATVISAMRHIGGCAFTAVKTLAPVPPPDLSPAVVSWTSAYGTNNWEGLMELAQAAGMSTDEYEFKFGLPTELAKEGFQGYLSINTGKPTWNSSPPYLGPRICFKRWEG